MLALDGLELADLTVTRHVGLETGACGGHSLCELELGLGVGHQGCAHWTLDFGSGLCTLKKDSGVEPTLATATTT